MTRRELADLATVALVASYYYKCSLHDLRFSRARWFSQRRRAFWRACKLYRPTLSHEVIATYCGYEPSSVAKALGSMEPQRLLEGDEILRRVRAQTLAEQVVG